MQHTGSYPKTHRTQYSNSGPIKKAATVSFSMKPETNKMKQRLLFKQFFNRENRTMTLQSFTEQMHNHEYLRRHSFMREYPTFSSEEHDFMNEKKLKTCSPTFVSSHTPKTLSLTNVLKNLVKADVTAFLTLHKKFLEM